MLCSGLVLTVHDVRHILSCANPIHLVIDLFFFFHADTNLSASYECYSFLEKRTSMCSSFASFRRIAAYPRRECFFFFFVVKNKELSATRTCTYK